MVPYVSLIFPALSLSLSLCLATASKWTPCGPPKWIHAKKS
jgi:hypothetical protein